METELAFKPGDVIQDYCDPFVKILTDRVKGRRCDNCFLEKRNLLRCGGCQLMYYCDKSCQKKDWKEGHGFECKSAYFKKKIDNPLQPGDFKRKLCRLVACLKLHPKRANMGHPLYDGTTRSFNDLMSHQSELKKDYRFATFCLEMSNSLHEEGTSHMDEETIIDDQYIVRLAGIWKTNAFPICNEAETEQIGAGIFIEPSVFDHSCKPTAFSNMQGYRMQIRAIGPIPKGTKPYVTYLVGHRTKQQREDLLMERYNFKCHCELCEQEEKSGDAVDYAQINWLIQAASRCVQCKEYVKLHEDILTLMRKLYHEYDQRITNRCFLTLQEAIGLEASPYVVKKLWTSAEEHIRITFGVENLDYHKLLRLLH